MLIFQCSTKTNTILLNMWNIISLWLLQVLKLKTQKPRVKIQESNAATGYMMNGAYQTFGIDLEAINIRLE